MPITAFATVTAALSMAGFPLFLGFIGKEIMYKGALTEDLFPVFATSAALLANSLVVAVAGLVTIKPFLGNLPAKLRQPHEAPMTMWLGPVFMGALGLIFGIFPDWVGHWLIEPAVRAFHPSMEHIQLKLFYGINEPLLLSITTLSLGAILYRIRQQLRQFIVKILSLIPFQFEHVYTGALEGIAKYAKIQTTVLQNGSLHRYLSVIIAAVLIGVGLPFLSDYTSPAIMLNFDATIADWLTIGIIIIAVGVVVIARSRLLAICCLGVVGTGIAMLFLMHGAPDVVLTQLLVETLTVIIVALVLLRLPQLNARRLTPPPVKIWNVLLAASIGTMVTALILAVTRTDLDRSLTDFFEANSYLAAHGRNIVNVILVDFRSFDTLGEITVVALAGLAGYALIQKRKVN
jgi:multicomponent Na+:H+ antiporter subunit A